MIALVLGGEGMLGHKVYQAFENRAETWVTVRSEAMTAHPLYAGRARVRSGVEARSFDSVRRVFDEAQPDVVVNCIGVIKQVAEADDAVTVIELNALFPHRLAALCRERGARLLHVSTDCVFSGRTGGYRETDVADADDLYGRSKRLGEVTGNGALTLRTSIIGRELSRRTSLVEWFLANTDRPLAGYRRAVFSGLPTVTFAGLLVDLAERHPQLSGLYHVASDPINKCDLLTRLAAAYGLAVTIEPKDEPACDRSLDGSRFAAATGWRAPSWDRLVAAFVNDSTPYDTWRQN